MDTRPKLKKITLSGFKSFDVAGTSLEPGAVTLLLGANGAGKSNLIAALRLFAALREQRLGLYVRQHGQADAFLQGGQRHTPELKLTFDFEGFDRGMRYEVVLAADVNDGLIIKAESKSEIDAQGIINPGVAVVPKGEESVLWAEPVPMGMLSAFASVDCYQFHDTSELAPIVRYGNIDDAAKLHGNAGNLAAFLRAMKETPDRRIYYDRIVRHVRRILPHFHDFQLTPRSDLPDKVRLNWTSTDSDQLFAPYQLSDGSLRFIALAALLLQPSDQSPDVIVIDEPELGLHPAALLELTSMVHTAAAHSQVILATQSPALVDAFDPADIAVVERDPQRKASVIRRLDVEALQAWLAEYSLSELWEKNVLGGQP